MEKEKAQAVEQQAKVSEQKKAQLKQQGLAAPALFFFFFQSSLRSTNLQLRSTVFYAVRESCHGVQLTLEYYSFFFSPCFNHIKSKD